MVEFLVKFGFEERLEGFEIAGVGGFEVILEGLSGNGHALGKDEFGFAERKGVGGKVGHE